MLQSCLYFPYGHRRNYWQNQAPNSVDYAKMTLIWGFSTSGIQPRRKCGHGENCPKTGFYRETPIFHDWGILNILLLPLHAVAALALEDGALEEGRDARRQEKRYAGVAVQGGAGKSAVSA